MLHLLQTQEFQLFCVCFRESVTVFPVRLVKNEAVSNVKKTLVSRVKYRLRDPHPGPHRGEAVPVSVSGVREGVCQVREPQDPQADSHRSVNP
ncbi:unnamed protein product [Notodromas monacha]|uniref:Uncharacterized protein n=1 Tax=Notodromas monacha TaxID=399045 RepID=A0A7R9G949_9CRUS|nr:unnamed protein product [Notodromas monacha]CAG0913941.1 unnamed protein product [Notodromas monacha]